MLEMTSEEHRAFFEAVADDPGRLEEHVQAGGSVSSFLEAWRVERDAAAAARQIDPRVIQAFLAAPVYAGATGGRISTVRGYLVELLAKFWTGEATGKYGMTGESDWKYDLYAVLYQQGLIPGWRDGYGVGYRTDGSEHPEDRERADELVVAAIRTLVTMS